jgi:hypothetical protein
MDLQGNSCPVEFYFWKVTILLYLVLLNLAVLPLFHGLHLTLLPLNIQILSGEFDRNLGSLHLEFCRDCGHRELL